MAQSEYQTCAYYESSPNLFPCSYLPFSTLFKGAVIPSQWITGDGWPAVARKGFICRRQLAPGTALTGSTLPCCRLPAAASPLLLDEKTFITLNAEITGRREGMAKDILLQERSRPLMGAKTVLS